MKRLLLMMMLLSSTYYVSAAEEFRAEESRFNPSVKSIIGISPFSSKEIQQREGMSRFTTPEEVTFLQKDQIGSNESSDLLYRNANKMQQKVTEKINGQLKFGKDFIEVSRMYGTLLKKAVATYGIETAKVAQEQAQEALRELANYRDYISMLHDTCQKGIETILENSLNVNRSAIQMQSTIRGHQGRGEASRRRDERAREYGATKIQSVARGYRGRQEASIRREIKEEDERAERERKVKSRLAARRLKRSATVAAAEESDSDSDTTIDESDSDDESDWSDDEESTSDED